MLRLDSSEGTKEKYPFDFTYRMIYSLNNNVLEMETIVENRGNERMYFAVGGHPGFNVPMTPDTSFEDYRIEFSQDAHPYRIILADSGAVTPGQERYELKDRAIPLKHELFDHDAIVLVNASREAAICSDKTDRRVTVSYPDFRYVGFWHKPCTDAPYVCIEPWTSLPSREGIVEDLALQGDLIALDGGKEWRTSWSIRID